MNMTNKVFTTRDKSRLMCAIWDNVDIPIGIVQIIHGIFDNMSVYDKLATYLNRNGYIVFGVDKTLNKSPRTFAKAVSQEADIIRHLNNKYMLPIFLIGFGYGGFVAQSVIQDTDTPIAGVCLIKSGMRNRLMIRMARILARIGAKIFGPQAHTNIINFLKRNHCGQIQKSPMCTYDFCESLFDGMIKLDADSKYENPILIISGAAESDPTSASFSRALYNAYHNNDLINTTLLVYPDMQNKLLLEMNCGRVQGDILSFFNDANLLYQSDTLANSNGTIFNKSDGAN